MSVSDKTVRQLQRLSIPHLNNTAVMYVHPAGDKHVSKAIVDNGIWEAYETELILNLLKPGSVLVDVGANIGYYSIVGGLKVGNTGKVFAFEPESSNFELLTQNIAVNHLNHVHPVKAGLSADNGQARIYLSDDNYGDHQIYDDGSSRPAADIELINGSQYLAEWVDCIDVLKIDTQGAEFGVLVGLDVLINQSLPNLSVIIEFWPNGLKRAGSGAHQLLDLLLSYELPLYIIDHIDHRLIPCQESDLRCWINELDRVGTNEGFMNLFLGQAPQ